MEVVWTDVVFAAMDLNDLWDAFDDDFIIYNCSSGTLHQNTLFFFSGVQCTFQRYGQTTSAYRVEGLLFDLVYRYTAGYTTTALHDRFVTSVTLNVQKKKKKRRTCAIILYVLLSSRVHTYYYTERITLLYTYVNYCKYSIRIAHTYTMANIKHIRVWSTPGGVEETIQYNM